MLRVVNLGVSVFDWFGSDVDFVWVCVSAEVGAMRLRGCLC